MGCSVSCGRRRDAETEDEEPAKPQILPEAQNILKTNKKSPLSDPRLMSPQVSTQTSPPAVQQSHPHNAQLLPVSAPTNRNIIPKLGLRAGHNSLVASETVEKIGLFAKFPKWLNIGERSSEQRKSTVLGPEDQVASNSTQAAEPALSNRRMPPSPKVHVHDPSTEPTLEQYAPSSSSLRTSLLHTADQQEVSSSQVPAQQVVMSSPSIIADDHSTRSHEAGSSSWGEIPDSTLKRIEANQFPFNLVPAPDFSASASVENPIGYPATVTTLPAQSYLMTTIPPYAVKYHRPNQTRRVKTTYYEVQDEPEEWGPERNIWFGFSRINATGPPGTRLGSIGINRNDGGLYYNNVRIGNRQNFDFNSGAKIGIGIVFLYTDQKSGSDSSSDTAIEVRVIRTRQGVLIDNERVETLFDGGRDCFDGDHDLFATVGTVGRVVFEVAFEEKDWKFKPKENGF